MSYGRHPHYIYSDGQNIYFDFKAVPHEAVGQFVASMVARGDKEIAYWVNLGKAARPGEFDKRMRVTVKHGWVKKRLLRRWRVVD